MRYSKGVNEGQRDAFSRPSTGSRDRKFQSFQKRLKNLKVGYRGLGDALRQYATQLGPPDARKTNEYDTRRSDSHVTERPQEPLKECVQMDKAVDNKNCEEENEVRGEKVRIITLRFVIDLKSAKGSSQKGSLGC